LANCYLEKGAILDFQLASKLQEIIPETFKTYKRTYKRSSKYVKFIIFLGPTLTCKCKMVAILKNGRHLGFSNGQSGKFD